MNPWAAASIPAWIDTHCHLDAAEFDLDRDAVIAQAQAQGVARIVIPAVSAQHFDAAKNCALRCPGGAYALGIHPLYIAAARDSDIDLLREAVAAARNDPHFVAIGEIGLDYFVEALKTPAARARQEWFFVEQLKVARDVGLPVILHVRRAQDAVLKQLRRHALPGGIAHAFNGSAQQAAMFIGLGFKLGFGGAMTFARAARIRQHARDLPDTALVLETDAPDIPPEWLMGQGAAGRNTPGQLPRIAAVLAQLRGWTLAECAQHTIANACDALPRLALATKEV